MAAADEHDDQQQHGEEEEYADIGGPLLIAKLEVSNRKLRTLF